jgi:hypothetical protein
MFLPGIEKTALSSVTSVPTIPLTYIHYFSYPRYSSFYPRPVFMDSDFFVDFAIEECGQLNVVKGKHYWKLLKPLMG